MYTESQIPRPVLFNPLKHHICFIRDFINSAPAGNTPPPEDIVRYVKHIGGSVMDLYTGHLTLEEILTEVREFLKKNGIVEKSSFAAWSGIDKNDFRVMELTDGSLWTLKYQESESRYVHLFPARFSPHSIRVKANTLKTAILYNICIGKDFITEDGLNKARAISGLSPIRDVIDSEAITEMIEMLRG